MHTSLCKLVTSKHGPNIVADHLRVFYNIIEQSREFQMYECLSERPPAGVSRDKVPDISCRIGVAALANRLDASP